MVAGGGSNCNVWSFNYSREQYSINTIEPFRIGYDDRDLDLHAKYPFGHLFEHNIVERIASDDYHGDNGPYNTFVRNLATGDIARFRTMTLWSALGNMEKDGDLFPLRNNYDCSPAQDIYGCLQSYTIALPHNLAYDYGFYSLYRLDDVSYYYSSMPAFLNGYSWPAIGPKTRTGGELSYCIPAKDRFNQTKKTYLPNPTLPLITTSGTMFFNQTWSGTISLTGNVTVNTGVTLTLAANSTLNMNGYYIICPGTGKIVKQGIVTLSGSKHYAMSGSDYKGFFPSSVTFSK